MRDKYKKIIYCLLLLFVFIIISIIMKVYFAPIVIILLIIITCNFFNRTLMKLQFNYSSVNAILSIVFVNAIFFLLVYIILIFMKDYINEFANHGYYEIVKYFDYTLYKLRSVLKLDKILINDYKNIFGSIDIRKGAIYTTDLIFSYLIGNISAYFIIKDNLNMLNIINKIIPFEKNKLILSKYTDIVNIFRIEIKLVIITTIETILGFKILGIDNAILLGILCGILDVIPLVGNIIVFIPLIIFKIIAQDYIITVGIILLYILLIVNRQIMYSKFIGNRFKMHPLLIMISLYLGIKIFGFLGLILGPVYAITVREIIMS